MRNDPGGMMSTSSVINGRCCAEAIAAQRRAVALYPQLAIAGSPLNRAFVARVHQCQTTRPRIFDNPDWPTQIAGECTQELGKVER